MKNSIISLTISILCFSTASYAQLYIGGSIGNSFINKTITDVGGDDLKIDGNDFGYKVYGGFGRKFIGVEGGYRAIGKIQTSTPLNLQYEITGWDIAARGKLKIGPVFAFAKAGAFFAKSENQIGPVYTTDNTTNFLWGLGAGFKLGRVALRLEYESLDIDSNNNIAQVMVGAAFYLVGK